MITLLNKVNQNNIKLLKSTALFQSSLQLSKFKYFSTINNNTDKNQKIIEFKNGEIKSQYLINNNNNNINQITLIKPSESTSTTLINANSISIINKAKSYFLPKGYPNSVSPDYIHYYKWLFCQNVVGSVTYVLSTHALLTTVVGMSVASALPFAAAISWVLKDGLGAFALVFFANKFSTLLDFDLKKYKFRGDILHNLGVLLEMCTPFIQGYFLPLASISNLSKGLAGLIYGSTRASLNKSFSIKDNIGDITAKYQSQSMAAYLMGMGIGSTFGLLLSGSTFSGISIVFSLSFVHMFLGYKAVKSINLKSLNKQRLSIIIDNWLLNSEILNSKIVNNNEEFIFDSKYNKEPHIKLGLSSDDKEFLNNPQEILNSINFSKSNNNNEYFIVLDKKNQKEQQISVYYLEGQQSNNYNDQYNQNLIYIKSFFHSHIIRNEILNNPTKSSEEIFKISQEKVDEKYQFFINDLIKSSQWNINPNTILMMEIGESKFKLN
ncbi:hypothetical protein DICPUDRAFT_155062 [Dictyostelium purpureum]|uniref:Protein root UVB sensitive/RUS domain-containing protein n=1 Tax=Dictyostelium purpureum TaxID=5786 RepID=F0ZSZ7_DICPU|nr:uncharacterized protein DICPUDRAFT_155062 [Dictyostelium purpureum]EGC32940.1 hypothetical protein DICPUDRAFT_155062 [Dictyostelium purpureum]|eukprot:XP_003290548.1 hypothetical protein DICPUDRAFT_155062 [Dictyostelium purpureum]